jgi:predicted cobalt transporter CbtA
MMLMADSSDVQFSRTGKLIEAFILSSLGFSALFTVTCNLGGASAKKRQSLLWQFFFIVKCVFSLRYFDNERIL